MENIIFTFSWIIGCLIVYQFSKKFYDSQKYYLEDPKKYKESAYSAKRFILPLYPKYLIDRWKYNLWFITFLIFNFMLYAIVVNILIKSGPKIHDIPNLNDFQKFIYLGHPQIFGALIITGLLPLLPERLHIQGIFREFSQKRAKIPSYAIEKHSNIMRNGFILSKNKIKATINNFEEEIVKKEDFQFRDNSPEKMWALICYIKFQIEELTIESDSPYSKNLAKPDLAYNNFEKNFDSIKNKIFMGENRDFSEQNKSLIEALFSQAIQIIICLILCSEKNDTKAIYKFEKIGVNVSKDLKYKISYDLLIPLSLAIFLAVFILPWLIGIFLKNIGISLPPQISGQWAIRASVASIFILYFPIFIAHLSKVFFIRKWPIRFGFDRMNYSPLSFLFAIGTIWGIASFYLLDYIFPTMFEKGVLRSLPYSLLSGFTALIIGVFIDKIPTEWDFKKVFIKSIYVGIICMISFVFFTILAILIGNPDININVIDKRQFWEEKIFILSLTGSIGFLIGFINYLISDYSKLIRDKETILRINLEHYLKPLLKRKSLESDCDEILKIILTNRRNLPSKFFEYLNENNIIDNDGFLTNKGLRKIRMNIFTYYYN